MATAKVRVTYTFEMDLDTKKHAILPEPKRHSANERMTNGESEPETDEEGNPLQQATASPAPAAEPQPIQLHTLIYQHKDAATSDPVGYLDATAEVMTVRPAVKFEVLEENP